MYFIMNALKRQHQCTSRQIYPPPPSKPLPKMRWFRTLPLSTMALSSPLLYRGLLEHFYFLSFTMCSLLSPSNLTIEVELIS